MTHEQLVWQGITALVTILTVLATYLKTRRERKSEHAGTVKKLDVVQSTVNGQTAELHGRIDQLTSTLKDAGVDVPNHKDV